MTVIDSLRYLHDMAVNDKLRILWVKSLAAVGLCSPSYHHTPDLGSKELPRLGAAGKSTKPLFSFGGVT